MIKIRIAVASLLLSALVGGAAVQASAAVQTAHHDAGPVMCCSAVFMGQK
jgi:hypothetical protein